MERKLRITVDGRSYNVTVEDLSEGSNLLYPHPGSMNVPIAPAPVAAAAPAMAPVVQPGSAGPGDVVATLGGAVEAVLVTVGQEVAQGETVVVLEAMKMKSPMTAPRAGKVTRVAIKAGEAVETGQVLVTIG